MGRKAIKIPITCKHCGIGFFTLPCRIRKDVKFCSYKCHNEYKKTLPDSIRFWDKVDKTNYCWNWTAYKNIGGYGQFHPDTSTSVIAHRYSYFLHFGEIPKGLDVCHKCDNRKCVNPDHLFLGTAEDNIRDAKIKGRLSKGIDRPSSKLNETEIREIRKINKPQLQISKIYNVSPNCIYKIIHRKTWKHVV